ncbi:lytic polysaccharide monooxygenase [Candidatus Binatia bacterium]|jgi:chitin-binding protein|nr:lytic polysaccharide monooxygenase [Candidatus Binatia bacterium]
MNRSVRLPLVVLGSALLSLSFPATRAFAHGTMIVPESRIHRCAFDGSIENPQDPACRAAVEAGGKQALYDWNGMRQASADGHHRDVIADGQLCSGGNPDFAGLALGRDDWRTTPLVPAADGSFELVFHATAPHATRDWQIYVTRDGWDANEPLGWDDVDPFCTSGPVPLTTDAEGRQVYRIPCTIPPRSGRHVIFAIWQRSDSPEAFYSCSDVQMSGGVDLGWKQIGRIAAPSPLAARSTVTFRLFDETGADLEQIRVKIKQGDRTRARWPVALAKAVNAQSQLVHIGVLQQSGDVVPTRTIGGNLVYAANGRSLRFEVDVTGPGGGDEPVYPAGIGTYGPGTVVRGSDGRLYECRPFPASGWCNQAPAAYAPGTGWAWGDAWIAR